MRKINVELINVSGLVPIEGFSIKRSKNIETKILSEGVWTKPIIVEKNYMLILDGHHRFNICKERGFKKVPAVLVDYSDVGIRSLRKNYQFSYLDVISNALSGSLYPYKTVKHDLSFECPAISIPLAKLV